MTLNPCRVCGESELLGHTFGFGNPRTYGVRCSRCGHEITTKVSSQEAVWLWNNDGNEDAMKPCPFCNGGVELRDLLDGRDESYMIHCNRCHMNFRKFAWNAIGKRKVIEEWNRRVSE